MKLKLKYDIELICQNLLKERLDASGIPYKMDGSSEVMLMGDIDSTELERIADAFVKTGIRILDDEKTALVERIKEAIDQMITTDADTRKYKVSEYLSEKLHYSYSHLANTFSETTYTSIERFIILRKIDYAKTLIGQGKLTLTEIAYRLNYSSVAHLSNQFKKVTGLTPTVFLDIVAERRQHKEHILNDRH